MAPKDSSMEFLLYRLEMLEKRIDSMEKSGNTDLINILLKLLEKQSSPSTQVVCQSPTPTTADPQVQVKDPQEELYDNILTFARRRTIV